MEKESSLNNGKISCVIQPFVNLMSFWLLIAASHAFNTGVVVMTCSSRAAFDVIIPTMGIWQSTLNMRIRLNLAFLIQCLILCVRWGQTGLKSRRVSLYDVPYYLSNNWWNCITPSEVVLHTVNSCNDHYNKIVWDTSIAQWSGNFMYPCIFVRHQKFSSLNWNYFLHINS